MQPECQEAGRHDENPELEKANRKLQEMSSTDALTGTRNRRHFDQAYASELKRMQRDGTDLSLLLLDIDHFKRINDTWGHQIGDECLRLVAQTIGQHIRRDSDTLARVGGEEFCILLPNTSAAGAIFLGETIRNAIAVLSPEISGQRLSITISIGIASSSQQLPMSPERLLNLADQALYRAKQQGRNRVELFEPAQDQGSA